MSQQEDDHKQPVSSVKEKRRSESRKSRSRSKHKKSKNSKRRHHKSHSKSSSSRSKSRSRSRPRKHSAHHNKHHSYSKSRSSSRSRSSRSYSSSPSRGRVVRSGYNGSNFRGVRRPDARDIHPPKGRVLGCFGLSPRTTEEDIKSVFSHYGHIENVILIVDRKTGISKGYSFIYFSTPEEAERAKDSATGMEMDGRRIRVDYSVTQRPHSPTPGRYYGSKTQRSFNDYNNYEENNHRGKNNKNSDHDNGNARRRKSRSGSRSRSRGRDRYSAK